MKLTANKRTGGDASGLRRSGRLPGVVYNNEFNQPVSVDLREFDKVFRSQGQSHVIDLDVEGENHEVLVREVQMNKRRRIPQHVDFYAVTAGQMVTVNVVLDYMGTPAGVRDGGQLDVQRREVQISILPRYIPEKVEIDISNLTMGSSLHIGDVVVNLPEQAELLDDPDLTLVTVVAPRLLIDEEEPAEDVGGEPEVIGREEEDEGGEEE